MEFYVDLAAAVVLRLLKDRRERVKFEAILRKIYNAIGRAMVVGHSDWTIAERVETKG